MVVASVSGGPKTSASSAASQPPSIPSKTQTFLDP